MQADSKNEAADAVKRNFPLLYSIEYTENYWKIFFQQGGAQDLSQAQLMPKKLNLNKLSDAGGLKDCGCRRG